jgi:hypothetical protein
MKTKKIYPTAMQRTKMRYTGMVLFFYILIAIGACTPKTHEIPDGNYKKVGDIPPPQGYMRDTAKADSFAVYLQGLDFKEDKTVYLYNGQKKANQDAQYAVLKMDVGTKDLQQCADAVIRLRAEFLFKQKRYKEIHFNFTNGERADYVGYAEGDRPIVLNNQVRWSRTATKDYSYKTFRKYLDMVFTYAGTMSLSAELKKITVDEIQPGDVFIQTGYPFGHAVIVIDVAVNKETGKKAFMLAQSYMPAQEIHVLKNPEKTNDPWFYNNFGYDLVTPEWVFKSVDLKRF